MLCQNMLNHKKVENMSNIADVEQHNARQEVELSLTITLVSDLVTKNARSCRMEGVQKDLVYWEPSYISIWLFLGLL